MQQLHGVQLSRQLRLSTSSQTPLFSASFWCFPPLKESPMSFGLLQQHLCSVASRARQLRLFTSSQMPLFLVCWFPWLLNGLRHLEWCSSFSVLLQAHKHGSCVGICRHIRPSLPGVCCWYQECCAISFPWDAGLWACSGTSDQGHATCFVDKTHSFGCARPTLGPAAV